WRNPAGDLQVFLNAGLEEPDQQTQRGEHTRWERHVAAFKALLHRARYPSERPITVRFTASQDVRNAIQQRVNAPVADHARGMNKDDAVNWWLAARQADVIGRQARPANPLPSTTPGNDWFDPLLSALTNMLAEQNSNGAYMRGYSLIGNYQPYHSGRRTGE